MEHFKVDAGQSEEPSQPLQDAPIAGLTGVSDWRITFFGLKKRLEKWFYKPDFQAIRIVMGTIKAHYLNSGDPAWLFVVAPPGTGKTTSALMGACGLEQIITLGDFTENTFLSGFFGHQSPGILEKLGTPSQAGRTFTTSGNAIFLAKDFTTVLSMRREKRAAILAQLREIHDGEFKRDFGTGDTKIWRGRITVIAAVTPALDKYYSIFSTLGERFLQVRWHRPDSAVAGERAIEQQGHEQDIRNEITAAIKRIFDKSTSTVPTLPTDFPKRIASLAEIAALGRTHVDRNGYGNREIEFVPEPEANTRISKGLAAIARGLAALKGNKVVDEQDVQDAMRVGLDCLTGIRRNLFMLVAKGEDTKTATTSTSVVRRELENMVALGLFEKRGDLWVLTERTRELLATSKVQLE
jgi:hypothetical protein